MRVIRIAALALAAAVAGTARAAVSQETLDGKVSSFEDIKYWFGSGTNQCAMVVDFNDGSVANSSFVWGYRWNGTAPSVETILKTIAAGDSRFTADFSSGWVKGFTYDLDDDGEADLAPESWYYYDLSEYDDDEIEEPTGYMVGDDWAASYATGELFHNLVWTKSAATANGMYPQNGQWFVQRFASYAMDMADWSYVLDDYETTVVPSLAEPAPALMAALPTVDGQFVATLADAFETARGGKAVLLPASGTVDPATKTITIGTAADETEQTFTVPAHFDMSVSGQAVTLALNQTAAPTLGTNADSELPPLTVTDTCVTIVPGNVIDGLYYGLSTASSLTKGFSKPTQWIRAEGGTVVLQAEKNAAAKAGFYKVCVSDVDEAAR